MKVLLDESVPRSFGFALTGQFVRTVQAMGWSGLKNGELLRIMIGEFDVLVTCDKNLDRQQNPDLPIALIVLMVPDTRVPTVMLLAPAVLDALANIRRGDVVKVFPPIG